MLRRAPTTLTITAEDVADYEDRRAAETQQHPQTAHLRAQPAPSSNWSAYHRDPPSGTGRVESDSDDYPDGPPQDEDLDPEDEEDEMEHDLHQDRDRDQSTMEMDINDADSSLPVALSSSPVAARGVGRAVGVGRGQQVGVGARMQAAGQVRRGMAQGHQQARGGMAVQAQGGRGVGAVGAVNAVTPEARLGRSREERIGVAQPPAVDRRRR